MMWSVWIQIFIFIVIFGKTLASDALGKEGLTLTVEHGIDKGSGLAFEPRGFVSIKNMKGNFASYRDDEDLSSTELEKLKAAAVTGSFYHIRIPVKSEKDVGGKETIYLSTFIKACSLLQSNLSDIIKLHVDSTGHIFAVGLSTTTADCSDFRNDRIAYQSLYRFNTTVILSHVVPGPAPDTQTYIRKIEEERREKQRGKGKDNRSFFAKYWMYIVPLVIFLMLSGQDAPPAGGAGGGGGGGGGS